MQVLASITSQQINYSSLSKEIEVSAVTIKEWISVLQASGIYNHMLKAQSRRGS